MSPDEDEKRNEELGESGMSIMIAERTMKDLVQVRADLSRMLRVVELFESKERVRE